MLRSSTSVNNTMVRTMDSRSECHGTAEAGLSCARIESCIGWKPWSLVYGGCVPPRENSDCKYQCKAMESRAIGVAAPWYRRGRIFVESSIPFSHGGSALVMKGAEEVENAEANSKYQDKAEGQRPRNFIRPVSMGFLSR
ncbi:hypothetical protein BHE74_00020286 [Ensete ventricosum]|nr:hypothetical protein BHE74_00020286 [Ensete ventricosum]